MRCRSGPSRREHKQHVEGGNDVRAHRILREERPPRCPIRPRKDVHLDRMQRLAARVAEHAVFHFGTEEHHFTPGVAGAVSLAPGCRESDLTITCFPRVVVKALLVHHEERANRVQLHGAAVAWARHSVGPRIEVAPRVDAAVRTCAAHPRHCGDPGNFAPLAIHDHCVGPALPGSPASCESAWARSPRSRHSPSGSRSSPRR
jgi:hypothetical protein